MHTAVAKIKCDHACINSRTFLWSVSNTYIVTFRSDNIYLTSHQNQFMPQKT